MLLLYLCKDLTLNIWAGPYWKKIVLVKTKAKGQSPTDLKIDVFEGKT